METGKCREGHEETWLAPVLCKARHKAVTCQWSGLTAEVCLYFLKEQPFKPLDVSWRDIAAPSTFFLTFHVEIISFRYSCKDRTERSCEPFTQFPRGCIFHIKTQKSTVVCACRVCVILSWVDVRDNHHSQDTGFLYHHRARLCTAPLWARLPHLWAVLCLCNVVILRMWYKWNQMVCNILRLDFPSA